MPNGIIKVKFSHHPHGVAGNPEAHRHVVKKIHAATPAFYR